MKQKHQEQKLSRHHRLYRIIVSFVFHDCSVFLSVLLSVLPPHDLHPSLHHFVFLSLHSFLHSFGLSFIHSFTLSFPHQFTLPFIHSLFLFSPFVPLIFFSLFSFLFLFSSCVWFFHLVVT
eukprot:m.62323 g.62323  ORF g.62323 m.62323 type:complete len:121 (+) comp13386_c1_seq5:38-400(+)